MNRAHDLDEVRKFLGWSFQELAKRTGFSRRYLMDVHNGRPLPEVDQKLQEVYVQALGEKAANLAFGRRLTGQLLSKSVDAFSRIVRKHAIPIMGTIELYRIACKPEIIAGYDREPAVIDDISVWEAVLESLAVKIAEGGNEFGSNVTPIKKQDHTKNITQVIECQNCQQDVINPKVCKCPICGSALVVRN